MMIIQKRLNTKVKKRIITLRKDFYEEIKGREYSDQME
jgi:hypothetical protein